MPDPLEPLPFVPIEEAASALGVELRHLTDEARVGRIELAAFQQGWAYVDEEHLEEVDGIPRWTSLPPFHRPGEFPTLPPGLVTLLPDAGHIALTRGGVAVTRVHALDKTVRYTLARPEHLVVADLVLVRDTYKRLACSTEPQPGGEGILGSEDPRSPDPDPDPDDEDKGRVAPSMTRRRGLWTVIFAGEECKFLERSGGVPVNKGLRYLAELIKRPGDPVPAVLLEALLEGHSLSEAQIAEAERGVPVIDEQALREVAEKRRRCRENADQARAARRFQVASNYEDEVDQLTSYLKKSTDHRGRPRYEGGRGKKAGTNVQRAIKRVIEKIREQGMRELAEHLSDSLEGGRRPCYRPATDPGWRVEIN